VGLLVPDDLVRASGMTESEMRLELAVMLYRDDRLTLGQAARLAGLPQAAMLSELARRRIAVHYGVEDLEEDLVAMKKLFPR
jgi:predicted HTH domain antitoxin